MSMPVLHFKDKLRVRRELISERVNDSDDAHIPGDYVSEEKGNLQLRCPSD